jgi:hypothetical protein
LTVMWMPKALQTKHVWPSSKRSRIKYQPLY